MAGPEPTDFGVMDPPAGWVVCGTCRGECLVPACVAGTDCPHEPRCRLRSCATCGGDGGWQSAEVSPSTSAQDQGSGIG